MEHIIYNKYLDQCYIMYFNPITWCGALYYGTTKLNFNREGYIRLIVKNYNMEYICEL